MYKQALEFLACDRCIGAQASFRYHIGTYGSYTTRVAERRRNGHEKNTQGCQ